MCLFAILFVIACLFQEARGKISNCRCSSLQESIGATRDEIINRYGMNRLRASGVLGSYGANSDFVKRLYNSVSREKPLRLAMLGGSFTLQEPLDFNPWISNVTRWLDIVLSSASNCNDNNRKSIRHHLINTNITCRADMLRRKSIGQLCASTPLGNISIAPVLFCQKFNDPEDGLRYHPNSRPLQEICGVDAYLNKARCKCPVYDGSGAYATVIHAGKGNTATRYGEQFHHATYTSIPSRYM